MKTNSGNPEGPPTGAIEEGVADIAVAVRMPPSKSIYPLGQEADHNGC